MLPLAQDKEWGAFVTWVREVRVKKGPPLCVCELVCVSVCVLGSYKGEEGGQEKEQNFLLCVVLCPLVLLSGRAQHKE